MLVKIFGQKTRTLRYSKRTKVPDLGAINYTACFAKASLGGLCRPPSSGKLRSRLTPPSSPDMALGRSLGSVANPGKSTKMRVKCHRQYQSYPSFSRREKERHHPRLHTPRSSRGATATGLGGLTPGSTGEEKEKKGKERKGKGKPEKRKAPLLRSCSHREPRKTQGMLTFTNC